jgi:hypothetical protein
MLIRVIYLPTFGFMSHLETLVSSIPAAVCIFLSLSMQWAQATGGQAGRPWLLSDAATDSD